MAQKEQPSRHPQKAPFAAMALALLSLSAPKLRAQEEPTPQRPPVTATVDSPLSLATLPEEHRSEALLPTTEKEWDTQREIRILYSQGVPVTDIVKAYWPDAVTDSSEINWRKVPIPAWVLRDPAKTPQAEMDLLLPVTIATFLAKPSRNGRERADYVCKIPDSIPENPLGFGEKVDISVVTPMDAWLLANTRDVGFFFSGTGFLTAQEFCAILALRIYPLCTTKKELPEGKFFRLIAEDGRVIPDPSQWIPKGRDRFHIWKGNVNLWEFQEQVTGKGPNRPGVMIGMHSFAALPVHRRFPYPADTMLRAALLKISQSLEVKDGKVILPEEGDFRRKFLNAQAIVCGRKVDIGKIELSAKGGARLTIPRDADPASIKQLLDALAKLNRTLENLGANLEGGMQPNIPITPSGKNTSNTSTKPSTAKKAEDNPPREPDPEDKQKDNNRSGGNTNREKSPQAAKEDIKADKPPQASPEKQTKAKETLKPAHSVPQVYPQETVETPQKQTVWKRFLNWAKTASGIATLIELAYGATAASFLLSELLQIRNKKEPKIKTLKQWAWLGGGLAGCMASWNVPSFLGIIKGGGSALIEAMLHYGNNSLSSGDMIVAGTSFALGIGSLLCGLYNLLIRGKTIRRPLITREPRMLGLADLPQKQQKEQDSPPEEGNEEGTNIAEERESTDSDSR